jgi:hypothetical protein
MINAFELLLHEGLDVCADFVLAEAPRLELFELLLCGNEYDVPDAHILHGCFKVLDMELVAAG